MHQDYFSTRRSVRKFRPDPVAPHLLDSIIERAMKAPTTGNMQLYSVVVTTTAEGKKALSPAHFGQPAVEGCAAVLTVCADLNRFVRWCRLSDADPGFDNFLSFISAMLDATIFAQQICTIAEMEGLGTCYMGTVTFNAAQVADILKLPPMVVPVACITLGYPAEEGTPTERLPLEAVVHHEAYRQDSDADIMRLFKAKDEYEPNAAYVAEHGKKTLAQVFTDVRYPREMNETFSRSFIEFLQRQGFLPK